MTSSRLGRARAAAIAAALMVAGIALAPAAQASGASPAPSPSGTTSLGDGGQGTSVTFGLEPVKDGTTSRGSFQFTANDGDSFRDAVSIYNYSNRPLTFRLYAADALNRGQDAGFALQELGEKPATVGTWIDFGEADDQFIRVEGRTQVDVPFTLTVPKGSEPGDFVGGVLLSVPTGEAPDTNGVLIEPRIGVPVRVRVGGLIRPELSIVSLAATYQNDVEPWSPGDATVLLSVKNTGNVAVAGDISLALDGPLDFFDRTVEVPSLQPVLPGAQIDLEIPVDQLWPAVKYDVSATVVPVPRQGDPAAVPDSATVTLWAFPWPQVVALILLILLGVGFHLWRRGRAAPAGGRHADNPKGLVEVS